ncbi:MAG: hypothetical protein ACR2P1_24190 [Pseudomonadales bacterium]
MSEKFLHMTEFLATDDAENMLRIAESFGSFGTYADEGLNDGLGEALPQRFDAGLNYIAGGLDGSGNDDDVATAASRTNYFRETYAYGDDIQAAGIEAFMDRTELKDTAREISGCPNIVPAIVYANLLIPGQELAVHTDVPEFRGANRKTVPQWLLVTMLHSGLFDEWRIPIVTCVSWFGAASGGAFTFYPGGSLEPRQSIPAIHNSAIILDTDKVFHGVERVNQTQPDLPSINQQTRLHFSGKDRWQLREGDSALAEYSWPELRYSISWKAYCFASEEEESLWREGSNDLNVDFILDRIETDLRERRVLAGKRPEPTEFAMMMVQDFVRFPTT